MPLDVDELTRALTDLAPAGVRCGVRLITAADVPDLRPVEAAHIERAVDKRRNEYATGRRLLRDVLGRSDTIPTAADRKPVLPADVVGSLAHDNDVAVAVIADAAAYRSLGVDVEPATPLRPDMAAAILRPDERLDAHLAFTLKEAVYKAWSTDGGGMLEHHDVRLEVGRTEGPGAHEFSGLVIEANRLLTGRFVRAAGHWLALVAIPVQPLEAQGGRD